MADHPKISGRILVVDDEKNITFVIQAILERVGFETLVFNESTRALDAIENEEVDTIVTDLYMPGPGGMEILEYCQKNHPQIPVVIITAYGTVESAVSALKRGAFDFVTKPFEQTELVNVIQKAVLTYQQRQKESVLIVEKPSPEGLSQAQFSVSSIIGNSSQMRDIFKIIAKISASSSTVLIWGESGTGKELVAYEIHKNSARVNKPFVKINCAAIPATLIESELFGYEKGAFTGAVTSKPGRFELANEGTLFLDEVAEMPLEMQVKLLRVLQEQEFERVGGVSSVRVDVRIITATNKDLEAEVRAGKFREDLFYRLNVVPIHLPPLRERREDIDPLIRYFLQQFNEKLKRSVTSIDPRCMEALRNYAWPGNIRQLENALERMMLMGDGNVLTCGDLPEEIQLATGKRVCDATDDATGGEAASFKELVRKQTQTVEKELIERALEETGGNVTRTAEKLGLSRKGLQIKIKELGIRRQIT
jgi:two-component system, NtrC family, response regulator AtoC